MILVIDMSGTSHGKAESKHTATNGKDERHAPCKSCPPVSLVRSFGSEMLSSSPWAYTILSAESGASKSHSFLDEAVSTLAHKMYEADALMTDLGCRRRRTIGEPGGRGEEVNARLH